MIEFTIWYWHLRNASIVLLHIDFWRIKFPKILHEVVEKYPKYFIYIPIIHTGLIFVTLRCGLVHVKFILQVSSFVTYFVRI